MNTVGLSVLLGADFSSAEEAMTRFYASVQALAKNVQSTFTNMGGTASSVSNMFKPISDGAQNASKIAINESKARQQADNELTQWALNSSKLRIQAIRDETAAQRAKTQAKRAELDSYRQLTQQVNDQVRAYYNASAAAVLAGDKSEQTAAELTRLASAARIANDQLKAIEAGAGRFQRNVGNYSGATQYLSQSIAQITGEIPNFFQSMRIGFMSVGNNIQPVIMGIQQLRAENAELAAQGLATRSVLGTLAKTLFGWQTLIFVGVGLISAYGSKLIDWATGANKAKAAAERLKKQQDELNQIDKQATASAGAQIGKLKALQSIIEDNTQSNSRRKKAYEDLIALYPSYFQNINLENAKTGGLTTKMYELRDAIIAAATARAFQDKINKLISDNIELENKRADALDKTSKAQFKLNEQQGKNAKVSTRAAGQVTGGYAGGDFRTAARLAGERDVAQSTIDEYTDAIKKNKAEVDDYLSRMRLASKKMGDLMTDGTDKASKQAGSLSKLKKSSKEVVGIMAALNNQFDVIDKSMSMHLIHTSDVAKEKLEAVNNAIKSAIMAGYSINSELMQQLKDLKIHYTIQVSNKTPIEGAPPSNPLQPDFDKKPGITTTNGYTAEDYENYKNKVAAVAQAVQPVSDMVHALFEGENAAKAFGDSVKDLISDLAAYLVKAAAVKAISQALFPDEVNAFKGMSNGMGGGNPLGGLLGFALKLGLPFLADGGIVSKPTVAMIGEAGPEAVVPLKHLNQYAGNNDLTVHVKGRIRGRELDIVNQNYQKYRIR